jgi:hypothetical protein
VLYSDCMDTVKLPPLTSDFIQDVIYGMENQNYDYAYFPESQTVHSSDDPDSDDDNENAMALPDWSSRDGFALMVKFAEHCTSGMMKIKLQYVLNSHKKGVFRSFREVLETDPEVLSKWYDFKLSEMSRTVRHWYRKLGMPVSDENDEPKDSEPVLEDFSVEKDFGDYDNQIERICGELPAHQAFVCLGPDDELAGFICYNCEEKNLRVLSYFVNEELRRIGIFDLMYEKLEEEIRKSHLEKLDLPVYAGFEFVSNKIAGLDSKLEYSVYSCTLGK